MTLHGALTPWAGLLAGTALLVTVASSPRHRSNEAQIRPIDPPEREFFSKVLVSDGIPIKAHRDVSDEALREAARRIHRLLAKIPVVQQNLVAQGAEVHIIGKDQSTSDLPEWRHMKGKYHWDQSGGKILFDDRTRGMGGLISSCGEENLLKLPTDRYKDHRDICSHEFSHGILTSGVSPDVHRQFEELFKRSTGKGLWKSYAGSNVDEYFAEITMWYIGSRGDYGSIDPKPEPGPAWLKSYDPEGYALIDAFYSGKLAVKPVPVRRLKPSPSPRGASGPTDSRRTSSILVDNRSRETVKVFSLGKDGARRPVMDVPPGDKYSEDAVVGQEWLVTTEAGAVVGYYVSPDEIGLITITAEPGRPAPAAHAGAPIAVSAPAGHS